MTQEQSKLCSEHITEYREQIKQHREAIIALNGAIQALERLLNETEETESGDEQVSD